MQVSLSADEPAFAAGVFVNDIDANIRPGPLRHRRSVKMGLWALAGVGMLAALFVVVWQISRARCFSLVGPTLCRIDTTKPIVALTFDDGPTTVGVAAILPVLARHHAHATFFLIGREIERHPELVRTLVASGHQIGNHSYSHVRMIGYPQAFYRDEIERTDALIRANGGATGLFRPPGAKKLLGLPLAVQRAHLLMVMWNVEDPRTDDPAAFARKIVAKARPGSVILIHAMNSHNGTARRALPMILNGLEAKGLRAVSVGELMRQAEASD